MGRVTVVLIAVAVLDSKCCVKAADPQERRWRSKGEKWKERGGKGNRQR